MNNKKFTVGIVIIVSAIIYLAISGFNQDLSYYKTAEELIAMGDRAYDTKLKVAGQVIMGSIERGKTPMTFDISQGEVMIPVEYIGTGPVPDTFKDHAQVVLDGKYFHDGIFRADKIQAKCSSKYESRIEEANK